MRYAPHAGLVLDFLTFLIVFVLLLKETNVV